MENPEYSRLIVVAVLFCMTLSYVACSASVDSTGDASTGGTTASDNDTTTDSDNDSDDSADTIESVTLSAYDEIATLLTTMGDLAETAASDSATATERLDAQDEIDALITEINDLSQTATFGDRQVLFGSAPATLSAEGSFDALPKQLAPLEDAVLALSDGDQTVEITYSFVIAGTSVVDIGTTYTAVELKDQADSSVDHAEAVQDISEALTLWEDLFEKTFNPANGYGGILDVKFTNLGDETGTSQPLSQTVGTYAVPGSQNLGMFRYAMAGHMATAAPFSPTGNPSDGIDDSSGEISFGSGVNWRLDRETTGGSSFKIVAAHEMGHGFGFGHDQSSTNNIMNPANITQGSVYDLFPDGLFFKDGGSEAPGVVSMYGSEATLTDPDAYTLSDGTTADFPAVNAATLGVNAIKVRGQDEAEEAVTLIDVAQTQLASWRATVAAF